MRCSLKPGMSLDRTNTTGAPLKPTLASSRTPRGPLTPRVTVTAGNGARSAAGTPVSTIRSLPARPIARVRPVELPANATPPNGGTRSRSRSRRSQGDSVVSAPVHLGIGATSTTQMSASNPRSPAFSPVGAGGLKSSHGVQPKLYASRPNSTIMGEGGTINQVGYGTNRPRSHETSVNNHFFHASDAKKPEPVKKPEVIKSPAFFYADGMREQVDGDKPSPSLSGMISVPEQRGIIGRAHNEDVIPRTQQPVSPGVSQLQAASSYFASQFPTIPLARSPSPSKENIHLSYRKGASQIFGTRNGPKSTLSVADIHSATPIVRSRPEGLHPTSVVSHHRKLSSSSSIDSARSERSRPLTNPTLEFKAEARGNGLQRHGELLELDLPKNTPLGEITPIDTSAKPSSDVHSPGEPFSPTKGVPDMAAEARRERKVLDLEISNSSLLAINASLEREVRRQKAELKRFRRLSRAGRLSSFSDESRLLPSAGLSTLDEDDFDSPDEGFPSGLAGPSDDLSDAESESMTSGEPLSPAPGDKREHDRLARDEKRLQVDLQRHRELLVQSQMMNQSIRRCIYATEEMISGGKKALEYRVRVSDIRLGGRILTGHEDEEYEEIEVDDDHDEEASHVNEETAGHQNDRDDEHTRADEFSLTENTDLESAHGLLRVWQNIGRPSVEGSEAGDRDSGIEIEKSVTFAT